MRLNRYLIVVLVFAITLGGCGAPEGVTNDRERLVDSLLQIMTIEEKIGQMTAFTSGWDVTGPTLREEYRDDIVSGRCGVIFNAHTVKYNRVLQELAVNETRLGIPLVFGYDVIHGHKTIFPIPIGEACSWDSVLIEKSARLSAMEAAASGLNWTFNPVVDICRDPRWGRIAEGSGEDVLIGAINARAKVRGYQGESLDDPFSLAACVKHFAGYGAPQAGRDYNTVDMSERVFLEDYLPPYSAAIKEGAATIMTSFNEIFGVPASGSQYLLKEILRDKLGFEGLVITDYTSINEMVMHGYASDVKHSAELALKAGVDVDMQGAAYYNNLKELLEEGKVETEEIDEAVRRVLRLKYDLGLFHDPYLYLDEKRESEVILSDELLEHALYAAERSVVLLKNQSFKGGKILPVTKTPASIAVIGPLGDNKVDLLGSWHASGAVSAMKTLKEAVSEKYKGSRVSYVKGAGFKGQDESEIKQAVKLAKRSDLVILAVGENFTQSGEAASRTDIDLPGVQRKLVEEVLKTGKPVIVVVFAGRPLSIGWMQEKAPAIIYAWQPGTMAGEALSNIIHGDYNPSAKLTITFPESVGQIPVHYDMKNTGRPVRGNYKYQSKYIDSSNEPLYPFGYGLSYTEFSYSDLSLSDSLLVPGKSLSVKLRVKNTGKISGEEIVQLYIRDIVGSITRPVLELKAFQKISLAPDEEKEVVFTIQEKDLLFMNNKLEWITEPGEFRVFVGSSSAKLTEKTFWLVDG